MKRQEKKESHKAGSSRQLAARREKEREEAERIRKAGRGRVGSGERQAATLLCARGEGAGTRRRQASGKSSKK